MNVPLADGAQEIPLAMDQPATGDDLLVGLAFSGGGTRAAAFSFGVLQEMDQVQTPRHRGSMLDTIDFVSGVSGGSVTAAYFGLRKREALVDFRERFLIRNAEENITTTLSLDTIGRAFTGGINESTGFTKWLDANLFSGATYGQLISGGRPYVWINASDIYNRVPFIFAPTTFSAICSDLARYPISSAVAASAAVPLAFAPAVVQAFPDQCRTPIPGWIKRAAVDKNASPMLSSYAKAVMRYRDGKVPFIKLLDGGLVDNYGLSGFTVARESSPTPYGPLDPQRAARLRRAMFLVVDAKTGISGDWVRTLEGPSGVELIKAAVDTTIDASVGASYAAFDRAMADWQGSIIKWRCGLNAAQRASYGVGANWNCRDLKVVVGRVGFDQLDPQRARALEAVPTRFNLPAAQVDEVIAAGRDALRQSSVLKSFLAGM